MLGICPASIFYQLASCVLIVRFCHRMTRAAEPSTFTPYHGRFAPTPSGPLHFGSLIAALGSYLQARARGGSWSVRIDDLDQEREQPGAAEAIVRDLERLGLVSDYPITYQSRRLDDYEAALTKLHAAGQLFDCGCSRRESGDVYPGTCRGGLPPGRRPRSLRVRVPERGIHFKDRLCGPQSVDLRKQTGDFIVRRADRVVAYHLALVVDDAEAGITEVVRGADLLAATAPQILLQQLLALPTPEYMHLPVACDAHGQKISKQNHARPIGDQPVAEVLYQALTFLGQQPVPALLQASTQTILAWGIEHWDVNRIPTGSISIASAISH